MSHVTAYERIAEDLSRRIAAGEWSPGSRLPSVPDLADEYTRILGRPISVGPVRQALTFLRARGEVEYATGIGNFVAQRPNESTLTE